MATYVGSMSEALDECKKTHDRVYNSISPEFKKKIKLVEARIEKAKAEYLHIKEKALKSMPPKLREEYNPARKKLEKVWLNKDNQV